MSIYERAARHARRMLGALAVAVLFVLVIDQYFGHSTIAFAIAILGLVIVNAPMRHFNCPSCGKNLFFKGLFVMPWPNRTCGQCGKQLDKE